MDRHLTALLALSITGCAPQDAEVTAHWFAWLSASSSATVAEGRLEDLPTTGVVFECSGRGWDEDAGDWDEKYIGPKEDDDWADKRCIGGDCAREYNSSADKYNGANVRDGADQAQPEMADDGEPIRSLQEPS